jgi:tRNA A-37 threonylcarbamoyl transferase component Bud32
MEVPWSRLVVKRFGWRGPQHYLFSPLKRSRAMKAYRTACHLLAHRLATPLPLAVFEERHWGFVQYNVYATEAITDYITLRQYRRTLPDGAQGLPEVLQLAADYTRRMHDSGLWHRDMVLSNFLLTGPSGRRRLYLVDLNRAYHLPYVPSWLRAIDIARMDWETWQPQFVERYCGGRYATRHMLRLVRLYRRWRTLRRRVLDVIKPVRRRLRL